MLSHMRFAVVVGALLVAPSALALGPVEPKTDLLSPLVPSLPDAGQAAGAVATAAGVVDGLLECRSAVRVPVALLWGDVTDTRTEDLDLRVEETLEVVETHQIPVYETFTQTVWAPGGLLGFLKPVTREVTRLTGYDLEEVMKEQDVPLDVHVDWRSDHWDFDGISFPIQVALPIGLEFLAEGTGELIQSCDGSVIHETLPEFPDPGHDHWGVCIGCTSDDADLLDGWYVRVLGTRVLLAGADPDAVPVEADGIEVCPTDVLRAAGLAASGFAAGLDGPVELPPAGPPAKTDPTGSVDPAGTSTVTVPATTAGVLAGLLSTLGAVAVTAGSLWRRR